ncbi:MAG: transcriptional repressor, partial [Candidatus Micrarchaeota archaeon]|nr:transcriptional repressor [Candidatus Micrarchaeota archaeon]
RRMTTQRILILDYLKSVKTHPTAEMVHEALVKKLPTLTLATVYRNLNLLAEEGKILRLEIGKEYHYDGFNHSHIHCVCTKCGKVLDVENSDVIINIDGEPAKGFMPHSAGIIIYGLCARCAKS